VSWEYGRSGVNGGDVHDSVFELDLGLSWGYKGFSGLFLHKLNRIQSW
jgi:hypothetical protein